MFCYWFAIPGAIDSLWHATHMLKMWSKLQVPCLSLHLIPLVLDPDSVISPYNSASNNHHVMQRN
ncbi:hypothetical protein MJO29_012248 [Puccinia striiformis f. sp. tritici]|uniref:Uncharacterized protein n=1 Tax=Puccinia striiformis TaxID=27350 RepID=A0A2S4WF97_9BASI|nr:hypothetical protein MJO29_012248 [Puccinia striiformis f. sp. tritici]POW20423.1 hypothetical protein PSHT_03538 [Puccinia striiformis]